MKPQTKWNKQPHNDDLSGSGRHPVIIGDSIWYSSAFHKEPKGVTEYCLKSKKILQTIQYPANVKPEYHCCCLYQNKIYIIDTYNNGEIILFDPKSKRFAKKQTIPKLGGSATAIVIRDNIRIFHVKLPQNIRSTHEQQ